MTKMNQETEKMNCSKIEKKWQTYWDKHECFKASDDYKKEKRFNLVEFPYPSGVGMHLGHIKAYLGLEIKSRMQRLQGYNVLFPMGFDAFGLPAENYAMQVGRHPREITDENIEIFTNQLKRVGLSFDFSRVIDTTDPEYYKWTQWIFLKLYEYGLVFKDRTYVNYCPICKVVLSNEDSQGGKCDRCDSDVIQKEKDVWFLRITKYADKLLEGLDKVDYPANVRASQENWIGKSTGAYVDFKIKENNEILKVYTTRPDTLFGVTFMVIAPEHPLIDQYASSIKNMKEIKSYRKECQKKTEFERTQLVKDKTGVKIDGFTAINPVNNESIPVYISDYVMMSYGTGAIMAVPAHDDRDYEFATKFNIPVTQVIAPSYDNGYKEGAKNTKRTIVYVVIRDKEDKYLVLDWKKEGWRSFVCGGVEEGETIEEAALREAYEESGYKNIVIDSVNDFYFTDKFYASHKDVNREVKGHIAYAHLKNDEKIELAEAEEKLHTPVWIKKSEVLNFLNKPVKECIEWFYEGQKPWTGNGTHINSDFLDGLNKQEAIDKMLDFLTEKGIGEQGVQYKMKDWAFNRQRYWGEPIPIVYCEECGQVPVPYNELPLVLPKLDEFIPGEDGESPLSRVTDWVNCSCPKCGQPAKRETDTMPQWAGSSWYYLRYCDPHNKEELCSKENMDYWMNVDVYNGGAEHITRHMIYSRFWHHFLYDIGVVNTEEPYQKRTTQGLILGSDGSKMSKSKGNTIDPLDVIEEYSADILRSYVLFMGDYADESPWSEQGVKGISRFLDRVERLNEMLIDGDIYRKSLETDIHKTIKKVTDDIENMKYNTAIAEMMKLVNRFYHENSINKKEFATLLVLLYPFAPHLSEELNEMLGNDSITTLKWPTYDESKLIETEVTISISINGKMRATITVKKDLEQEKLIELAKQQENIIKYIEGKEIKKVIVVPNKVVNIIV